ncbi:hypothetical protein [Jannaschia sp. R86511]|uniref:hypothetical protein n=1 Tax=Jannaschia sp. R86511 TaxID=3093853 RepID=UPI0036D3BFFB
MSSSASPDRRSRDRSTDLSTDDLSVHHDHDRDVPGGQEHAAHRADTSANTDTGAVSAESFGRDRASVVDREKEEYGGVKIGSAFFGWLTATGTVVLLSAFLAAVGAVVGFNTQPDASDATADTAQTAGIIGAIVFLVVLFVAYYCGGYVAGRMARFNGVKQGVAVWVWAVVIAAIVAVLGVVAGDRFDVLAQLESLPPIPVTADDLTTGGIVALLAVAVTSLIGAILGGLAGMRFHRKVDKAGLGH